MNLQEDLQLLVEKYEMNHTSVEVLRSLSDVIGLQLSNLALQKRMNDDVFDLFDKDENNVVMGEGGRLRDLCKVVSVSSTKTCAQVSNEAVIELAERNSPSMNSNNKNSKVLETMRSKKNYTNNKRALQPPSMKEEVVRLCYSYNELSLGSHDRAPGVSVLESPCCTINLTISMSRGIGGFDKVNVVDFQLLTARFSPSQRQTVIDTNAFDSSSSDCSGDGGDENREFAVDSEVDDSLEPSATGSDDDQQHQEDDASDYYSVSVDRDALSQVHTSFVPLQCRSCCF